MTPKDEPTRFDQIIRWLKNRPAIAMVLLLCVAVIGLGQVTGALRSILSLGGEQASVVVKSEREEPRRELKRSSFINYPPPDCIDNDQAPPPEPVPLRDNETQYWNLALLRSARVAASSSIESYGGRHQITFLNDGWYNNCRSWIPGRWPGPGQRMAAWCEIDLGDEYQLFKIALGSEHTVYYNDRTFTRLDIAVDGNTVISYNDPQRPIQRTTSFSLPSPIVGQTVRISIPESDFPIRIDEVEIYGNIPP